MLNMSAALRLSIIPLVVLVFSMLGGCGHMPVMSMVRLARVEFDKTDPAQLRAAVKIPKVLRPVAQGVALRVSVRLRSGEQETNDFLLSEIFDPAELYPLRDEVDATSQIYAYRLSTAEAERLGSFRVGLLKRQQASGGRGGSLTIEIKPDVCRTGTIAHGPVLTTTYLRTGETGSYVPLARNVDLRTVIPGRDVVAAIPSCK
jgi:hypothetical protein